MDHFPAPVLSNILQYAVTQDSTHNQISAIRVCSAYYLAAIPLLYRSPRVTWNIDSFFLHADDPPANFASLNSEELFFAGHAKLAAFRYVHHLHLLPPIPIIELEPGTTTNTYDQRFGPNNAEQARYTRELEAGEAHLQSLPPGIMPNIDVIQIGPLALHRSEPSRREWSSRYGRRFAISLLARISPRVWCQRQAESLPLIFPHELAQALSILPLHRPIQHIHVESVSPVRVNPGVTSYIYLHLLPTGVDGGGRQSPRMVDNQAQTGGAHLASSFASVLANVTCAIQQYPIEQQQALLDSTRIVMAGIVAPSDVIEGMPPGATPCPPGGDDELDRGQEVVDEAIRLLEEGNWWRKFAIDIKKASEMPPCPVCGTRV